MVQWQILNNIEGSHVLLNTAVSHGDTYLSHGDTYLTSSFGNQGTSLPCNVPKPCTQPSVHINVSHTADQSWGLYPVRENSFRSVWSTLERATTCSLVPLCSSVKALEENKHPLYRHSSAVAEALVMSFYLLREGYSVNSNTTFARHKSFSGGRALNQTFAPSAPPSRASLLPPVGPATGRQHLDIPLWLIVRAPRLSSGANWQEVKHDSE